MYRGSVRHDGSLLLRGIRNGFLKVSTAELLLLDIVTESAMHMETVND